jgi:hypothetical protein
MARSDLLVSLVRAGATGDRKGVRSVTEAIIAEERAKQHTVLADRLANEIRNNGGTAQSWTQSDANSRGRDFVAELVPRRQLDELTFPAEIRLSVDQFIEEQLRADLLRMYGLEPRNRVLLTGAPGTGKTVLAEAIAESLSIPLFVVRYEAIIGSYLGETATRLKRVFDYARTVACVLFFDEFDAIGKERGDLHETGEIKRVVSALLMQVDDLPSYTIVVGATNHPELLDRAAWRRFQLRLALPFPDQEAIAAYIDRVVESFGESLGVSTASIAAKLGPMSYAEAEEFCVELRRRQILSLGQKPLKHIVSEQLQLWSARSSSLKVVSGDNDDGASPTSVDSVSKARSARAQRRIPKRSAPRQGKAN